jgi:integrase
MVGCRLVRSISDVQRAVVRNRVDAVKTEYSERPGPLDPVILQVLSEWRRTTEFNKPDDWIWASPAQAGTLPLSYAVVMKHFNRAAKRAGLGHLGTHSFRHSFRSWLDANGTLITVQQTLMRHADIRTTMRYGETLTAPMREAHSKVVRMVLPGVVGL